MKRKTNTQLKVEYQKENRIFKKAVKGKCLECMCEQHLDCEINDCTLYQFQPFRKSKSIKRAHLAS